MPKKPQAPKRWCFDCGKYIGRRWGDHKLFRCSECLEKVGDYGRLDDSNKRDFGDIPF